MATTASALRDTLRDPPQDPKARKDLYNAALETVFALESQQDTAQRLYHGHVPLALAQTGIDLQLFEIVSKQPEKHWTLAELAGATRTDPVLLCNPSLPWRRNPAADLFQSAFRAAWRLMAC